MTRTTLPLHILLCSLLLVLMSGAHAQQQAPAPQVAARLIAAPSPTGDSAMIGLELDPQPGWHTYWQNPGDAGLPTKLRWTVPADVHIEPLRWPTPTAYREGDLLTYGYGARHTLITPLQIPPQVDDAAVVQLKARWLVCKDICIPESGEFSITVGQIRNADAAARTEIATALRESPEDLNVHGSYAREAGAVAVHIPLPHDWHAQASALSWFPAQADVIDHAAPVQWFSSAKGLVVRNPPHRNYANAADLEGVLVIEDPHGKRAINVRLRPGPIPTDLTPLFASATQEPQTMGWWLAILMAFAGGLILNLMPCVFPVLALKALSLTRAETMHARRMESLAYTAGVIASFLLIAQTLLLLRAGGAALGWGFQLQNPVVVGALAVLMWLMALAMLGWTQIGMGFMGWGQSLTAHSGLRGAFFTGVLAVVVASPCSAPFMGGALGYAVLQPAPVALSIFAALGLGLAAPFIAIAWIPALAARLPRPGAWMETLKHIMAVPLLLTAAWLYWVLWRQSGNITLLVMLLSAALLALGMRQSASGWQPRKTAARILMACGALLLAGPLVLSNTAAPSAGDAAWQPWSEPAITQGQAENRLILVDFTADWCLSCLVNENAVLANADVQADLTQHDALLLKADWTQYDPAITQALAQFGRNGVPLYLLYPTNGAAPEVLPQILTIGLVRNAIARAVE